MPEPYRVGIIGTGGIARAHARAVRSCGRAELAVGADVSMERLESWARQFDVERVYTEYEEMLNREQLDIVAVCTWPAAHLPPVLAAARARHKPRLILCEKPLALNAAEARQMYAAANEAGVPLVEGFMYRFLPHVPFARQLLEERAIGQLRLIRSGFTSGSADLRNHRLQKQAGGGSLMDLGCYCVNSARALARAEPEAVLAAAQFGEESGVDEGLYATLRFPNGVVAHFDCGFRATWTMFVELVGEEGTILLPDAFLPPGPPAVIVSTGSISGSVAAGGITPKQTQTHRFPATHAHTAEYVGLCAYLDSGAPLPIAPDEGVRDMAVIDSLYESARVGRWVEVKGEG